MDGGAMQAASPQPVGGGGGGGASQPPLLLRLPACLLALVAARLNSRDLGHFRLACKATREAAPLTSLSVRARRRQAGGGGEVAAAALLCRRRCLRSLARRL